MTSQGRLADKVATSPAGPADGQGDRDAVLLRGCEGEGSPLAGLVVISRGTTGEEPIMIEGPS
jgi:hypothetical protein